MKKGLLLVFTVFFILPAYGQAKMNYWSIDLNTGAQLKSQKLSGDYPAGFETDFQNLYKPVSVSFGGSVGYFFNLGSINMGLGIGYEKFNVQHKIPIYIGLRQDGEKCSHSFRGSAGPNIVSSTHNINNLNNTDYRVDDQSYSVKVNSVEFYCSLEYSIEKKLTESVFAEAGLKYSLYVLPVTKTWRTSEYTSGYVLSVPHQESYIEVFHSIYPFVGLSFRL